MLVKRFGFLCGPTHVGRKEHLTMFLARKNCGELISWKLRPGGVPKYRWAPQVEGAVLGKELVPQFFTCFGSVYF